MHLKAEPLKCTVIVKNQTDQALRWAVLRLNTHDLPSSPLQRKPRLFDVGNLPARSKVTVEVSGLTEPIALESLLAISNNGETIIRITTDPLHHFETPAVVVNILDISPANSKAKSEGTAEVRAFVAAKGSTAKIGRKSNAQYSTSPYVAFCQGVSLFRYASSVEEDKSKTLIHQANTGSATTLVTKDISGFPIPQSAIESYNRGINIGLNAGVVINPVIDEVVLWEYLGFPISAIGVENAREYTEQMSWAEAGFWLGYARASAALAREKQ